MLTVDDLKQCLPPALRTAATQNLADMVNNITADPEMAKTIRDNFVGYTHVLKEGRFKTEDYLFGVTYVSFKIMGYTNQEAYKRTFPARYQALVARGATEKDISAYVSAYNKNKMINMILEQTLVPVWVLNQDIYQSAINTQAKIMLDVNVNSRDRTAAANSLLTHLKKPETKQVELSIGVNESNGMTELNAIMQALAGRQQELIAQGATTREIAHQPLSVTKQPVSKQPGDIIEATAMLVGSPPPTQPLAALSMKGA